LETVKIRVLSGGPGNISDMTNSGKGFVRFAVLFVEKPRVVT